MKCMQIKLCADDKTFYISFKTPTKKDLCKIDGPDCEGQVCDEQVYIDRQLDVLHDILETGCTYKIKDTKTNLNYE